MNEIIADNSGKQIASVNAGEVYNLDGALVGTARKGNVYDRNGKFIFHLQAEGADFAGRMTPEAIYKLFHPKAADH